MSSQIVQTYSPVISGVDADVDVVLVLVLAAKREGENGERLALTPRQIESAKNNAAASLEIIDGTSVNAASTAFVLTPTELASGETLQMNVCATLVKSTPDGREAPAGGSGDAPEE